ncbi:MAG: outer membrane beta-barrel protein [Alphaproteobacteria bacterium]|nr:outer membrane beta-barrel protein [Alphaproteobacteria bacterium]
MKHTVTAGALLLSAGVASTAQAEVFDWTGFYVGAHGGYVTGDEKDDQAKFFGGGGGGGSGPGGTTATTTTPTGTIPTTATTILGVKPYSPKSLSGFIGGVHAGYNFQTDSSYVLGVEGDLDYSNIEARNFNASRRNRNLGLDSRWQGSLRARAGFTPSDDLLLYATGGVAFADSKLTTFSSGTAFLIGTTIETKNHIGWTAGIGADYALTSHWIGRVEVRYTDFGSESYQTHDGPLNVSWTQTAGLIGVSYKF